jgi:glucose/mannose-6-phosphate isomerase
MNLDDTSTFARLDPQDMLAQIDGLPDQLQSAWELGHNLPLPAWTGIRQVIVAGLGGSAIGGDLVIAYVEPECRVPVILHRDYGLPAWARGAETLVIASSHSGNTEETLSALDIALEQGCRTLAVSTGGQLADAAQKAGVPWWRFEHQGQPRAAVGFSFGLLLAILTRLELVTDPSNALQETVGLMKEQQSRLVAGIPVAKNPAKRIAGQLMGRWVTVFGAGALAPVARRWKCQINELAKAWSQFDLLPEGDHNSLEGIHFPQEILPRMMALFLRGPADHPRNRLRLDLTRKFLMLEGINTDFIDAHGDHPLANQWTMLHFGDYTAYYLAMAYGVDPTPVETLQAFKKEMLAKSSA